MKIIVTGPSRHGKDTFCEFLGLEFVSSSEFAANAFIYETLKDILDYKSVSECFKDRHNHRTLWFELIKAYNAKDKGRLANELFHRVDVYCGMRSKQELEAVRKDVLVIWIEASFRVRHFEDKSSLDIKASDCDFVIPNNGTLEDLAAHAAKLKRFITKLNMCARDFNP